MRTGLCDELLKEAYFWCIPQFIANDNFKDRSAVIAMVKGEK